MLRTAVSVLCALAVFSPVTAFAGEHYDRRDFNRHRTIERVRTIEFYNRNRAIDRRDGREWERRDARRNEARDRYWRDRRYDRREDRRDYGRDRYGERRIIIIPHFSF